MESKLALVVSALTSAALIADSTLEWWHDVATAERSNMAHAAARNLTDVDIFFFILF